MPATTFALLQSSSKDITMETYGFIGLGNMGYHMASNIRKKIPATATLHIYDVNKAACERFATEHAKTGPIVIASSVKAAATDSTVVISIVSTADQVRQVYLDEREGLIAGSKNSDRLILECSTIDSASTAEIGKLVRASQYGCYIDSPVSGGPPGAEAGTLSFMIGCEPPSEAELHTSHAGRAQQVLSLMGDAEKLFWCKNLGAGSAAKISNNYLAIVFELAVAEAMAFGIRSGIEPELLHKVIQNSSGQSFMGARNCPVPNVVPGTPASNGFQGGFRIPLLLKDLTLGINAAKEVSIAPAMAEAAIDVWRKVAEDPRCKDRDMSSVWLYLNDIKE